MSTEWYVRNLRAIADGGLPVFVVDYALEPDNVEASFTRNLAEGFVPYAAPRQLDRLGTVVEP